MSQKPNNEIPQQAFDWYDDYAHGGMDRRTFMNKLGSLAALGYSMTALTTALLPNYALAEQVSFNDPEIRASYESFASPDGHGKGGGYLVTPTEYSGALPAVLVVHENRGLNPYVKDVARRLAKSGYLAFAPDALFPLGGYPGNDEQGKGMQRSMDKAKLQHDFVAAAKHLKGKSNSNGKLGAVGFCYGGYMVNYLAAIESDLLSAGVPFYGTPAAPELRKNIKTPLLVQLGELDERVNKTFPEYQQDLDKLNVPYQMHMYAGAKHGFHNDSTARYDEKNAELAWQRTLGFLAKLLA
jgi:carboxymethylenebutenolidase